MITPKLFSESSVANNVCVNPHEINTLTSQQRHNFKIPKFEELHFRGFNESLIALSTLASLILTAQSAFAESKTGVIVSTSSLDMGSGIRFFDTDKKRECTITAAHVTKSMQEKKIDIVAAIIYGNGAPNTPIFEGAKTTNSNTTFKGSNIKYAIQGSDISFITNPEKPCTQEYLSEETGQKFESFSDLTIANNIGYKNKTGAMVTHRSVRLPNGELYENNPKYISYKPIGITVHANGTYLFVNIADQNMNPKGEHENMVPGASGSYSMSTIGNYSYSGVFSMNFEFSKEKMTKAGVKAFFYDYGNGEYEVITSNSVAEQGNRIDKSKLIPIETVLNQKLKEFGYTSYQG